MNKKVLVSGVKPTGRPHIGNYFGAIKQFIDFQEKYESFIFIADYHALTTLHSATELKDNSLNIAIDYLALGLDQEKAVIFKQSDVPEVTELAWIFECITTVPYLQRSHAFKDAESNEREVSVGTFNYPLLMAADILIQDADCVPVGFDQKQHIEYTRDTAEKFNRIFGETFKLPEPLILDEVKTVPGTDGRKMSKSYRNTIELFATDKEIEEALMKIPTDSKSIEEPKDVNSTLFKMHELFSTGNLGDLKKRYEEGGIGYKESKEILISDVKKFTAPLRERRELIQKDENRVLEILKKGGEVARDRANQKMTEVRLRVGL